MMEKSQNLPKTENHAFFNLYNTRFGGDGRDRTADLLIANQSLSHLSYAPLLAGNSTALFTPETFHIYNAANRKIAKKVPSKTTFRKKSDIRQLNRETKRAVEVRTYFYGAPH